MRKTASSSATTLQYQYMSPCPLPWCVSFFGRKINSVSVIAATFLKSHKTTAIEITPGNTIASPAQKLACQRAIRLFAICTLYDKGNSGEASNFISCGVCWSREGESGSSRGFENERRWNSRAVNTSQADTEKIARGRAGLPRVSPLEVRHANCVRRRQTRRNDCLRWRATGKRRGPGRQAIRRASREIVG